MSASQQKTTTEEVRDRCMRFHDKLLQRQPTAPEEDFLYLCDAWREAADAIFVWLWLHNDVTSEWELIACDSSFDAKRHLKETQQWPDSRSVAEYVNVLSAG